MGIVEPKAALEQSVWLWTVNKEEKLDCEVVREVLNYFMSVYKTQ